MLLIAHFAAKSFCAHAMVFAVKGSSLEVSMIVYRSLLPSRRLTLFGTCMCYLASVAVDPRLQILGLLRSTVLGSRFVFAYLYFDGYLRFVVGGFGAWRLVQPVAFCKLPIYQLMVLMYEVRSVVPGRVGVTGPARRRNRWTLSPEPSKVDRSGARERSGRDPGGTSVAGHQKGRQGEN